MLPGIFLGYALIAGGIRKGDILAAHMKDLENMDASEIHRRRINAKEVLTPQRREYFIFTTADGAAKLSGRDYESREPAPRREQPAGSENLNGELQGEQGLNRQNPETTLKPRKTCGRFTVNLEFNSMCRKKKLFFLTRATYTNLDVLQENRIDDYWNVDANRSLSDSWKGFTKFAPIERETVQRDIVWSR